MIDFPWLKAAPWAIALVAVLAALGALRLYQGERDDFTAFRAVTQAAGEQAERDRIAKEAAGKANLTTVKANYEAKLPKVRAGAVAAYVSRVRNARPGSSQVPSDAASLKLDDGAGAQCLDAGFIADAADDAAKAEAWRAYCALNNCPVED